MATRFAVLIALFVAMLRPTVANADQAVFFLLNDELKLLVEWKRESEETVLAIKLLANALEQESTIIDDVRWEYDLAKNSMDLLIDAMTKDIEGKQHIVLANYAGKLKDIEDNINEFMEISNSFLMDPEQSIEKSLFERRIRVRTLSGSIRQIIQYISGILARTEIDKERELVMTFLDGMRLREFESIVPSGAYPPSMLRKMGVRDDVAL